ncbi:MAG: hypothetical protein ACRBDL_04530 [Alphaproteobacteria bacterium]
MTKGLSTSLHFAPFLEPLWLSVICVFGLGLLVFSVLAYKRSILPRGLCFTVFMIILLNPSLLKEEREYIKDVATIVVDRSHSQNMGKREERTNNALAYLRQTIDVSQQFEIRVIEAPQGNDIQNRTDLFSALDQNLSDIPQSRRAGVIFITDGQIHDVPKDERLYTRYGPVHAFLSGEKKEKDRQLKILNAPAYGLVGKDVTVSFLVEDTKNINQKYAEVTVTFHDGSKRHMSVPVNTEQSINLPLEHPSQNIISLETNAVKDELTRANNKSALIINGVRDRLKVLLVSGVPHSGERTWRDLLTSDPGVDLVHFTILREPQKRDYTPDSELSLIAFPFRELFEIKLYDFDLIIFDRYKVNNILPSRYFDNIARYVEEGGAFLAATGPNFATKRSIYRTSLKNILPGKPNETVEERPYTPTLTNLGGQHPVSQSIIWNNKTVTPNTTPEWGKWLRYIDVDVENGDILMNGPNSRPLLILDRVGEGRVAQLSSDHIWLWSRGYDGGGPHSELLRRIVHWLMKEPELDESSLNVHVHKNTITIKKQIYKQNTDETIAMTTPEGEQSLLTLKPDNYGTVSHKVRADQLGIYTFSDTNGGRKFAIIGELDPPELRGIKTTDEKLSPLIEETSGATIWLSDVKHPTFKSYASANRYGGSDWFALKRNQDYNVTSVKNITLLPEWVSMLLLLSALIGLWWFEGRKV